MHFTPIYFALSSVVLILFGIRCVRSQTDDKEEGDLMVKILEFTPCEGYEKNELIFRDTEIWMEDSRTMGLNATLEVKREVDKSLKVLTSYCHTATPDRKDYDLVLPPGIHNTNLALFNVTRCEVGDRNSCENMPLVERENLCNDFFEADTVWSATVKSIENLSVDYCPIPEGEYMAFNAMMSLAADEQQEAQLKACQGEWLVTCYYYLQGEEVGCQYLEVQISESKSKKG